MLHRLAWSVSLALATIATAQQASLARNPSIWSTTDHSFVVAFKSSLPAVGSLEWGPTPLLGRSAAGPRVTDHALRLDGLDPDRMYWYRVMLDGLPASPVYRTRTFGSAASADLTFWMCADTGYGDAEQMRVAELQNRWSFQLGLIAGDVVYGHGERENYDPRFFKPYQPFLSRRPIFTVLGNHELETENGAPYFEAFHLPSESSGTERWYSFDAASVHFVGLDSTDPTNAAQLTWLRSDLDAARRRGVRWIFAMFHHAPYSSGAVNGSELAVRAAFSPILEEFEVDVVFTGHEHNYERTLPVREFHPNKRGVVYFVVGTGGYPMLYNFTTPQPFSAFRAMRHGFLKVDVHGDLLRTEFVDASPDNLGALLDPFEIRRSPTLQSLRATGEHPEVGRSFGFELLAPFGTHYAVILATQPGYLPLPPFGIFLLAIGNEVVLMNGTMTSPTGRRPLTLMIPPNNALRGADLFVQSVTQCPPAHLVITNLLETTIR